MKSGKSMLLIMVQNARWIDDHVQDIHASLAPDHCRRLTRLQAGLILCDRSMLGYGLTYGT
jgi:hypothetical protein